VLSRPVCPLTVSSRAVVYIVFALADGQWRSQHWHLSGRQSAWRFSTTWQTLRTDGHRVAEARLAAELQAGPGRHAGFDIRLDVLLQRPPTMPYLDLGTLGQIIMDMTGTLWGAAGETLSQQILGQPLGPPAALAVSLGCLGEPGHRIDEVINLGSAVLASGNEPGDGQEFGELAVDRSLLAATAQQDAMSDWLIDLGLNHGYNGVESEVAARLPG
jgi:hypothetical protein